VKNQPSWNQQKNRFSHPSLWKWGLVLVLVLVVCSAFLLLWRPSPRPVKVELLPFFRFASGLGWLLSVCDDFPDSGIQPAQVRNFLFIDQADGAA
jgi:hypothetical protein